MWPYKGLLVDCADQVSRWGADQFHTMRKMRKHMAQFKLVSIFSNSPLDISCFTISNFSWLIIIIFLNWPHSYFIFLKQAECWINCMVKIIFLKTVDCYTGLPWWIWYFIHFLKKTLWRSNWVSIYIICNINYIRVKYLMGI